MKKMYFVIIPFLFLFLSKNGFCQTCSSATIDSAVELPVTASVHSIDVNNAGNVFIYSGTYSPSNIGSSVAIGTSGSPPVFVSWSPLPMGIITTAGFATLADAYSLIHPISNVFTLMPISIASTIDVKAIRFTNNGDVIVAGEAFSLAPLTLNFINPFMPFVVNTPNKITFISYYSQTGVNVWNKALISSGSATVEDATTDALGNIYVTGKFYGTMDFDPGAGVVNRTTALFLPGGYVLKLDSSGNYVNVYTFTGGVNIHQIDINPTGTRVVVVGTAGYNPYAQQPNPVIPTTVTVPGWNAGVPINIPGGPDGYILVLNNALTAVNKFALLGGTTDDDIRTVKYDQNGDIVLGGYTTSTMNMDINGGTTNVSGNQLMVLAKYNGTSYALSWVNSYGGATQYNLVNQIIIDPNNNVVAGVDFSGNVPPLGTAYPLGVVNIALMKFSPTGILRNTSVFNYNNDIFVSRLTNRGVTGYDGVINFHNSQDYLASFTDNCP